MTHQSTGYTRLAFLSRLTIMLASALLAVGRPRPLEAQVVTTIVGGATLGAVLGALTDQVGQLIDNAKNAGNAMQMEAGREVYLALQNAQNAYSASMNQSFDRADISIKSSINQLHSMADDVENNTFGQLDVFSRRVQTSINALPLRPHQPQVATISPRFVALPQGGAPVPVRYAGNFEFAARPAFTPRLAVVADTLARPASNTTQDLTFMVPAADLAGLTETGTLGVRFVPAVLTVPWEETHHLFFHRRNEDTYRTMIGVLPTSPGTIRIAHYIDRDSVSTTHFVSSQYQLCSIASCGNNDHKDVSFKVSPDSGWAIVRNTSRLVKSWDEGDNSNSFDSDDGGAVIYKVTTIHHNCCFKKDSGKVIFTIAFDEVKHTAVRDSVVTVLDDKLSSGLHWGEQRSYPYSAGSYKVSFDAFDRSHADFSAADNSNRFLKVRDQAGTLVLLAADPATLVWP